MTIVNSNIDNTTDMGGMVLHNKNSVCNGCYWQSQCGEDNLRRCKDRDAIDYSDKYSDKCIDKIIEIHRCEYRDAFMEYMEEWN
jgi:hypothetical protein